MSFLWLTCLLSVLFAGPKPWTHKGFLPFHIHIPLCILRRGPQVKKPPVRTKPTRRVGHWSWPRWLGAGSLQISTAWMWTTIPGFLPGTGRVLVRVEPGPSLPLSAWRGSWTCFLWPAVHSSSVTFLPAAPTDLCWRLFRAHFLCNVASSCGPSRKLFETPMFTWFPGGFSLPFLLQSGAQCPTLAASGVDWLATQGWVFSPFIWKKNFQVASELCYFCGVIKTASGSTSWDFTFILFIYLFIYLFILN